MNILEISHIIRECYSECPRSLELYHDYAGFSLDECVDNFVDKLNEAENYDFHTFEVDGNLAGYYAITFGELPFLYTFFIKPEYRNSNVLPKFWAEIVKTIGDTDFMSGVYASNLPARKFLTRNGGDLHNFENISYYIFKGEIKCH